MQIFPLTHPYTLPHPPSHNISNKITRNTSTNRGEVGGGDCLMKNWNTLNKKLLWELLGNVLNSPPATIYCSKIFGTYRYLSLYLSIKFAQVAIQHLLFPTQAAIQHLLFPTQAAIQRLLFPTQAAIQHLLFPTQATIQPLLFPTQAAIHFLL